MSLRRPKLSTTKGSSVPIPLAEQMHHSHLVVLRPGQGLLFHVFSLPVLAAASLQALVFVVLVQHFPDKGEFKILV